MTTPVTGATDPTAGASLIQNYINTKQTAAQAADASSSSSAASAAATASSLSKVTGDYNTFLKILTAQLQNQDPLAATDTNQFTQELVQFSGVEQQLATNSKLDTLNTSVKSGSVASMLSYVGKYVEAPANNQLVVQGGKAQMAYTLTAAAQNVNVAVKDSTGATVATLTGPTTAGLHRISWDGTLSNGSTLSDGAYSIALTATNPDGTAQSVSDIRLVGQVNGLTTATDGTNELSVGGLAIKDTDVDAVFNSISTGSSTGGTGTGTDTGATTS